MITFDHLGNLLNQISTKLETMRGCMYHLSSLDSVVSIRTTLK
jgi:hypothetical protein